MQTLNIDAKTLDMCLKTVNNIGSTAYMNICKGSSVVVPWGGADWVLNLLAGGMILTVVIMLIVGVVALIYMLIKY